MRHLQLALVLRLVDLVAVAVEPDLLLAPQRLLQRNADADSLVGALDVNGDVFVVENGVGELVGLGDEGLLEALVVVLGDVPLDAGGQVSFHEVGHGVAVDGELALCADDFGHIVLAWCVHARAVEVCDLAIVELNDTDTVVDVAVLGEIGLESCDTEGNDGLDLGKVLAVGVGAEVPQSKVDVVDVAVDEDTARELGVLDEEARGVVLVTCLGAEDGRSANVTRLDESIGVAVGSVKAAGETTHDLDVGMGGGGLKEILALEIVSFPLSFAQRG